MADYVLSGTCAVLNVCNATTGCPTAPADIWTHHSRVSRAAQLGQVPLHAALISSTLARLL
jgi:hypothetical protein